MCYIIHLKVVEDGKAEYAKKFINLLSENGIEIEGEYPNFTLTDRMCSCDLVKENAQKINVSDEFFKKVLLDKSIKNIIVGWNWGAILEEEG